METDYTFSGLIEQFGYDFEIVRGDERRKTQGARTPNELMFLPGTDVVQGDVVVDSKDSSELTVTETQTVWVRYGEPAGIVAKYK